MVAVPPSSSPPLNEPDLRVVVPLVSVQSTVNPVRVSSEATLNDRTTLCSAVLGSTTKVPLPLPWVEASSAAFQLADPTVVSEYAAVRCTEFTSIAVLTSETTVPAGAISSASTSPVVLSLTLATL